MYKRKTPIASETPAVLVPQLLTIDQVAAVLCVGRSTVYELINENGLPYVLVREAKRVPVASLNWWIAQNTCSISGEIPEQMYQRAAQTDEKEPVSLEPYQTTNAMKKSRPKRGIPEK
jgi:excisionase family DNA binding protein